MRYAHRLVKSKRISIPCNLHTMAFDDRPDAAKRLVKARENRGFKTPKEAASYFGWSYETYIQHEQGTRGITRAAKRYAKAYRVSEAWLLTGEGSGVAGKVSGEEAIKDLLSRIDGLPEGAIQPVWRMIDGYIKDAEESSQPPLPAETASANPRREREPTR